MIRRIRKKLRHILKSDNRGMSLVELLAAMLLLALIVIPIGEVFITATRTNSKSRIELQAEVTANSLLEAANAHSIYNMDKMFKANSATSFSPVFASLNSSNFSSGRLQISAANKTEAYSGGADFKESADSYAFYVTGLKQSNNLYDALIVYLKNNKAITIDGKSIYAKNTPSAAASATPAPGFSVESVLKTNIKQEYQVIVFVYKHDYSGATPYIGQLITTKGSAATFEQTLKRDTAVKNN